MNIDVSLQRFSETGGLELVTLRLAEVLRQVGHEVRLLYGTGTAPTDGAFECIQVGALAAGSSSMQQLRILATRLEQGKADVHITTSADEGVLRAACTVLPTITYALEHSAICPEGSKYWSRLQRACSVRAGVKCAAARPLLGCGAARTSLDWMPIRRQHSYAEALEHPSSGLWVSSTDTRTRFLHQGLSSSSVAILPNLGMRPSHGALAYANANTPTPARDRVLFIGRLAKEKGAELLPKLRSKPVLGDRLAVIGSGYLEGQLSKLLGPALFSATDQLGVAGALSWARGVLFPSLWPEPGGVVGIDAQLFGTPVVAFAVGAALDWPLANLVPSGDVDALASWASALPPRRQPREPQPVIEAQDRYWRRVGAQADALLRDFVAGRPMLGEFQDPVRQAFGID